MLMNALAEQGNGVHKAAGDNCRREVPEEGAGVSLGRELIPSLRGSQSSHVCGDGGDHAEAEGDVGASGVKEGVEPPPLIGTKH